MIVADTNLIAYLLLPGPFHETARAVLKKDVDWRAPVLWRSELANVLSLYMRQGHLTLPDALDHMEHALRLLAGKEFQMTIASVLALAHGSGCSAYDCEFVQLAKELGVPLVTSDKKLIRAFPSVAISMDSFLEATSSLT